MLSLSASGKCLYVRTFIYTYIFHLLFLFSIQKKYIKKQRCLLAQYEMGDERSNEEKKNMNLMFEWIRVLFAPWIFMDLLIILDIFDERGTHFVSAHKFYPGPLCHISPPPPPPQAPLTISLRIILIGGVYCARPKYECIYMKRWHVFNEFSARWLPETENMEMENVFAMWISRAKPTKQKKMKESKKKKKTEWNSWRWAISLVSDYIFLIISAKRHFSCFLNTFN